jgi:hypothetical protein
MPSSGRSIIPELGEVIMAEHVCSGTAEDEASTLTHEPIAEHESPLPYSEAIELPEPPRWRARATVVTVAAVALLTAMSGWFLIGPGAPWVTNVPDSVPAPATTSSRPKPAPAAPETARSVYPTQAILAPEGF